MLCPYITILYIIWDFTYECVKKGARLGLNENKHVVVMGDFNDRPGMDFYEFKHGRSAVELVMGELSQPNTILHNYAGKLKWTAEGWKPSSARLKDRITGNYVKVLIDHILVSLGLPVVSKLPYKIWNPLEHKDAKTFRNDLLKASDHFPVTLDLNLQYNLAQKTAKASRKRRW